MGEDLGRGGSEPREPVAIDRELLEERSNEAQASVVFAL
jgi:hypothetical protein